MKRYFCCCSIIALILFCFSASAFAQMTAKEIEVRDTLQAHFKACKESGNYKEIISYFTPDAVSYGGGAFFSLSASIAGEKINPMFWQVGVENNEELVKYCKGMERRPAVFASTPGLEHDVVFLNVNVKGDHAIVLSRHTTSWPTADGNARVYSSHRSVWMLKKVGGEWKITSWIMGISGSQMILQNSPYSQ